MIFVNNYIKPSDPVCFFCGTSDPNCRKVRIPTRRCVADKCVKEIWLCDYCGILGEYHEEYADYLLYRG